MDGFLIFFLVVGLIFVVSTIGAILEEQKKGNPQTSGRKGGNPNMPLDSRSARAEKERAENERRARNTQESTSEVRTALTTFGLSQEALFDDVRRAYRAHVKRYHPDMVAHLGVELRKLAETKTKEFNSAYRILERHYRVSGQ